MLIFIKEQLSKELRERFALGNEGGKLSKTQKYDFFANHSFLRAMRSNHELITQVTLLSSAT